MDQQDYPGIDFAYLAMDTEEGVEVVWNEVQFSERKNFKAQEENIQMVFENLTQLEHANIVNFHRYWTDTHNDKPRVCIRIVNCTIVSLRLAKPKAVVYSNFCAFYLAFYSLGSLILSEFVGQLLAPQLCVKVHRECVRVFECRLHHLTFRNINPE